MRPIQPGSPLSAILVALLQVSSVRADLQALLPQAQARGSATVSQAQLIRWQNRLQAALDSLGQIVTILIFPPPPIATFTNRATNQIRAAQQLLASVPTTLTSSPEVNRASLSLQTLQSLIMFLSEAETSLIQAAFSAQ